MFKKDTSHILVQALVSSLLFLLVMAFVIKFQSGDLRSLVLLGIVYFTVFSLFLFIFKHLRKS
jgi:hypothetical protein